LSFFLQKNKNINKLFFFFIFYLLFIIIF
jgi:hypothetical protein